MAEYEFLGGPGDDPPPAPPPPPATALEPAIPPPAPAAIPPPTPAAIPPPANPGPAPVNPEGAKDAKSRNDDQTDLGSKISQNLETNNNSKSGMAATGTDFGLGQTTCGRPASVMAKPSNTAVKRRRSKPFIITMGVLFCIFLFGALGSAALFGVSMAVNIF